MIKRAKFYILITSLSLYSQLVFGQTSDSIQAFLQITEEQQYPYNEYTKTAQKHYKWTINRQPIKYKTGIYKIKVNPADQFDTVEFQIVFKRTDKFKKNRKPIYDSTTISIICKFRDNHNYKLGQIFPGHFEIYSLDTFETKKNISFKMINKNNTDTLYLKTLYLEKKVYTNTSINISILNEEMKQSFLQQIVLNKKKFELIDEVTDTEDNTIFELYFNFMHAENLEVLYDFEIKNCYIRIKY